MSHDWAFEGSEKKLEITFSIGNGAGKVESLRDLPRAFWASLVDAAGVKISSELASEHCDTYLLSESSLFVFKDRILMITCGRTQLILAAQFAIEELGVENLNAIYFERKNEVFPQGQHTTFDSDVEVLKGYFPEGKAHHVEYEAVGGFIHFFHFCKEAPSPDQARAFELVMHGLDPKVLASLRDGSKTNRSKWSRTFHFDSIFPNFLVNEFWSDHSGYTLNGILANEYFTIHLTPGEETSYVSLETNRAFGTEREFKHAIHTILSVFKPRSSLLVQFHHESRPVVDCSIQRPEFQISEEQVLDLPPGVKFSFNAIRKVDTQSSEEPTHQTYQLPKKKTSVWINQ